MGNFDGVNNAPTFETGNYFPCKVAKYKCEIARVLVKMTQRSGRAFIVEMKVLESDCEDVKVGNMHTWLQKLDNPTTAYPALKAFALAAVGVDAKDKEAVAAASPELEKVLDAACEKGALVGVEIKLETKPHTTAAGKQFTKHIYSPA